MNGFKVMLKMNLRLLLRNKGYLVCVILLPIMAVIIMNMNGGFSKLNNKDKEAIYTWKNNGDVLDVDNTKLSLKVFDRSGTKESDTLMHRLVSTGLYKIYCVKKTDKDMLKTDAVLITQARNTLESSTIRAVLIIPNDFTDKIKTSDTKSNQTNEAVKVITGYDDARLPLLQQDINWYCNELAQSMQQGDNTIIDPVQLKKTVSIVRVSGEANLTSKQQDYRSSIGYALAFLTISFIYSGVFIVGIMIKEKENKSYNRMKLTLMSNRLYISVKMVLIFITSFIQVCMFDIGLRITGRTEFGVPYYSFLGMILLLGVLYNLISLVIGTILGNLLGVTFVSFVIWSASSLMAGLYFPVSAGTTLDKISLFTPQRWLVKSCESFMMYESGVFFKFVCVILTFIIVFLTVGMIGLRINDRE